MRLTGGLALESRIRIRMDVFWDESCDEIDLGLRGKDNDLREIFA